MLSVFDFNVHTTSIATFFRDLSRSSHESCCFEGSFKMEMFDWDDQKR